MDEEQNDLWLEEESEENAEEIPLSLIHISEPTRP